MSLRCSSSGSHSHSPKISSFVCKKCIRVLELLDDRPPFNDALPNNVVVVVSDADDSRFVGGFAHNL